MASVRVLGKKIEIRFERGVNSPGPIDQARILEGVGEMAGLILGSAAGDIAFLVGFRNDPARIRARLLEGIG